MAFAELSPRSLLTLSINFCIVSPTRTRSGPFNWVIPMTETPPVPADSRPMDVLPTGPLADARMLQSEELFSGRREILIAHGQEIYRLRLTRSNKLILHK
jgi:hemin uptake protein HemP